MADSERGRVARCADRCRSGLRSVFGARGQLVVGIVSTFVGIGAWVYGSRLHGEQLLAFIFHVSMYFGVVACYSIIATALGYKATERVEAHVTPGDDDELN